MESDGLVDTRLSVRQKELKRIISKSHDEDTDERRKPNEKAEWIRQHIKMRKCSYYIASTKPKSESMCQCGYQKQDHDEKVIDRPRQEQPSDTATLKWTSEEHSDSAPTNAFGEIEFIGFMGNNAKFIRVDSETEIDTMLELMIDVWETETPNFLISVIGGTDNFNMTPRLRNMFRSGLVDVARKKNAWIITEGTHVGVAKHVGEAVKYSRLNSKDQKDIVAIGIAPWGVIQDKQLLEKESEKIQYTIEDEPNEDEMFLTPNHSHYILVDNGSQHQFGAESALRAKLELKCMTSRENDFKPVPVVLLVIDGGPRILKTVKNALTNSIPVVIVEGSGRVADVLAFAFRFAEESEYFDNSKGIPIKKTKKCLKRNQIPDISFRMKELKFCEAKDILNNIEEIKACLDKFELINIFQLGSSDQVFHETMLTAVLKADESDLVKQLRAALTLNLIDFARSNILTAEKRWEPDSLHDIMMSAIESHKVDVVELLIDNGVNIETFLTTGRLKKLYNGKLSSKSTFLTLLRNLREKTNTEPSKEISMAEVGKLITDLLDDNSLLQYSQNQNPGNDLRDDAQFENPLLHLLIWAVLNNMQDMAKLFWRKGLDSVAAALLAHALFSAMASRLKNARPNLYEYIEANSSEFMDLATGVLEECYRRNENYTRDTLTGDLLEFEKASCILIAMKTNNQTFICTTACQEVFNNVWMGEMTQENGILKLLICMFIPPLIPLCVKFKENKGNEPDAGGNKASDTVKEDPKAGASSPNEPLLERPPSHETNHGDETKYFRRGMKQIPLFYRAPVAKFLSHVISYMAFLCLYSYILISKFDQSLSVEDVILIAWVVNIFIEEINQVIATRYIYNEVKLKAYLTDFWNIADMLMILLFVIGMILKYLPSQETLEAARVVFGINLITCFLRFLQMFSLNKELGPKLVMIIRMVRNLTSFFVMLLIFIVAYAIASHAILYPDTEISFNALRVIFRRPYWNIYGELMLDEIEGTNDCTNIVELYRNGTQPRCPTESGKYVVPVLLGVYMLMCNILLLNLLISIFSNTFETVQADADKHWRIQRYHQIQDYISRLMFVPLISLIIGVFNIIVFLKQYPERSTSEKNVFLKTNSSKYLRDTVRTWERCIVQDFSNSKKADLHSIDHSVKEITLRLDQIVSTIDTLQMPQIRSSAIVEERSIFVSKVARCFESNSINDEKLQWLFQTSEEDQPGAIQTCFKGSSEGVEVEHFPDEYRLTGGKRERTIAEDYVDSFFLVLTDFDNRRGEVYDKLLTIGWKIQDLQMPQPTGTAILEAVQKYQSPIDRTAESEASTVDEPGPVTLDQRMDNIEKKTSEEDQPGAIQTCFKGSSEGVEVVHSPDEYRLTGGERERAISEDYVDSLLADLESFNTSLNDVTETKIQAMQMQQPTRTAILEEVKKYWSQIDRTAESESNTVNEPGPVTLEQRIDNIEKKTSKEDQSGAEQASSEESSESVEG